MGFLSTLSIALHYLEARKLQVGGTLHVLIWFLSCFSKTPLKLTYTWLKGDEEEGLAWLWLDWFEPWNLPVCAQDMHVANLEYECNFSDFETLRFSHINKLKISILTREAPAFSNYSSGACLCQLRQSHPCLSPFPLTQHSCFCLSLIDCHWVWTDDSEARVHGTLTL